MKVGWGQTNMNYQSASYWRTSKDSQCILRTIITTKDKFQLPDWELYILIWNSACSARGYITQLIRYSRTCISYNDFLDRLLLKNDKFKPFHQKLCYRTPVHELVDRYGISLYTWRQICSICCSDTPVLFYCIECDLWVKTYYMICNNTNNTMDTIYKAGSVYHSRAS